MSNPSELVDQMFAFPVLANYDPEKLENIRDAVKKENSQILILDFVSLLMKIIGCLNVQAPPAAKGASNPYSSSSFPSTSSLSKASSFASLHSLILKGNTGNGNSRSNSNNNNANTNISTNTNTNSIVSKSNSNSSLSNNASSNNRSCSEDTSFSSIELSTNETECTLPVAVTNSKKNDTAGITSNTMKSSSDVAHNELDFVDDSIKRNKLVKEVIHWLNYLSAKGFAEAQYLLGDIYSSGLLLSKIDNHRSFQLFLDAAKREHPESCYRVACCYESGLGCNKDASKAIRYLQIASSKSHPASLLKLGLYYFNGNLGIPKVIQNQSKGINLLNLAVQNATPITCNAPYELAKIYESGFSDILISDKQYALTLYKQAAKLGHGISCGFLGSIYELGNSPAYGVYKPDYQLSIYYYHLGAQNQDIISMMGMSGWYLLGCLPILNRNENKSFYWALIAAEKGLPKAQFTIAYFFRKGIGCELNKAESNRYAILAAENGYQKAKDYVAKNKITYSLLPRSQTSSSLLSENSVSVNNGKRQINISRRKSLLSLSNFSNISFSSPSTDSPPPKSNTRRASVSSFTLTNISTTTTTTTAIAKNNNDKASVNTSSSKRFSQLFRSESLRRLRSGFRSFSAKQQTG